MRLHFHIDFTSPQSPTSFVSIPVGLAWSPQHPVSPCSCLNCMYYMRCLVRGNWCDLFQLEQLKVVMTSARKCRMVTSLLESLVECQCDARMISFVSFCRVCVNSSFYFSDPQFSFSSSVIFCFCILVSLLFLFKFFCRHIFVCDILLFNLVLLHNVYVPPF